MELLPADKLATGEYTFYEVQAAFNQYWEGRPIERGKGWKQFKRWEAFMEPRVYPTGEFHHRATWEAYKSESQRPQATGSEATWEHIGPFVTPLNIQSNERRGMGRVNYAISHPDDANTIFVCAPAGGLWKSTDGGQSWMTTTDQLASIGSTHVAFHPDDPQTIFLATGDRFADDTYSIGVLKSTDGGLTWSETPFNYTVQDQEQVARILIDPEDADHIILATSAGIYNSTDGLQTATRVTTGDFYDMEWKPGSNNVIYASTYSWSGGKVFKSTNGGSSFTELTLPGSGRRRIALAVTPADPDVVYALASQSDNGLQGVYRSDDSGTTWTQVADGSPNLLGWSENGNDAGGQGWYDLSIAASPTDEDVVLVGGVNIWRSLDGGESWELNAHWYGGGGKPYVHADQHSLEFTPAGRLYNGNDGGFYISDSNGDAWTDMSDGLHILQIYRMGNSPQDPLLNTTGAQDNGTMKTDGFIWEAILGGDGMETFISWADPNTMVASLYYGDLNRSTNGGRTWSDITPPTEGNWVTPYVQDPVNPDRIYIGTTDIYRSNDLGDNWTNISTGLPVGSFDALAVAPTNNDFIYASSGSSLYATTVGGGSSSNWTNRSLPGGGFVTYIAVDPEDERHVMATISGYTSGQKVYRSINGGQSWTNYSTGLPNVPANCVVIQKSSNGAAYVGTDWGVYVRNNSMDQWELYNAGLPNVIVNELEINYTDYTIRAATYGRGLWKSDLYFDQTTPPLAQFTASTTQACSDGTVVTFEDASFGNINSYAWDFGANATPQAAEGPGPHEVSFSGSGFQTISLTVSGDAGESTAEEDDLLEIVDALQVAIYTPTTEFCRGSEATLYASGAEDYAWTASQGDAPAGEATVTVAPQVPTTYTVTGTTGACQGQAQVELEVNFASNDAIAEAQMVTVGVVFAASNSCASAQDGEPVPPTTNCTGPMSWCAEGGVQASVWYRFEAPATGSVNILTQGFDCQIALYDAESAEALLAGDYTLLGANDDLSASNHNARLSAIEDLTPGKVYWLQLDGSAGGEQGSTNVMIQQNGTVGLSNPEEQASFSIVPNPNTGMFELRFAQDFDKAVTIKIFNLAGQVVWQNQVASLGQNDVFNIDLSGKGSGLYLVELSSGSELHRSKVVVE